MVSLGSGYPAFLFENLVRLVPGFTFLIRLCHLLVVSLQSQTIKPITMHTVEHSISHTRYYNTQKEIADDLGITNSSKKSIASFCKKWGYGVEFNDYYGEYNIKRTR